MMKKYKIPPEDTESKQIFVSSFHFLLLMRFFSGIKCSPELSSWLWRSC